MGETARRRTTPRSGGADDRLRRSLIFIATPTDRRPAPLGATWNGTFPELTDVSG